jgi:hypothetical protein
VSKILTSKNLWEETPVYSLDSTMSVSESEYSSEEEEFRDDMRVFLRLRPINKLEQSRRSKNCIELHEDPTLITVDSPLEGEYDFTFDHVSSAMYDIGYLVVDDYMFICTFEITMTSYAAHVFCSPLLA